MSLGLRSHSELHNLDQKNSEFFEAANWVRPVSVNFHIWPSSASLFELKLNTKVDELQITLRDFELSEQSLALQFEIPLELQHQKLDYSQHHQNLSSPVPLFILLTLIKPLFPETCDPSINPQKYHELFFSDSQQLEKFKLSEICV